MRFFAVLMLGVMLPACESCGQVGDDRETYEASVISFCSRVFSGECSHDPVAHDFESSSDVDTPTYRYEQECLGIWEYFFQDGSSECSAASVEFMRCVESFSCAEIEAFHSGGNADGLCAAEFRDAQISPEFDKQDCN